MSDHHLAPKPDCECFDGGSTWHDGAMAWEYHLEPNPDCPVHFPLPRLVPSWAFGVPPEPRYMETLDESERTGD